MKKGVLSLLVALMTLTAGASAFADTLPRAHEPIAPLLRIGAIDMGHSSLVSRTMTGVSVPLNLGAVSRYLGTARFIGGIDTSAAEGAAVGGVTWQASRPDGLGAGIGVLRTGLPAVAGGGLLTQANLRLPLPFIGSNPSLGIALGSFAGDAGAGEGDAGRVSLAADVFGGRYSISYAQAQAGFRPLGSQLAADQANLDFSGHYTFGPYQLTQTIGFQPISLSGSDEPRVWRSDTFWGGPVGKAFPLITAFQLHAGLQRTRHSIGQYANTEWLLEAQGTGMSWRMWQFDTGVALGRTAAACMPTDHAGWRLDGMRPIRFGDFAGSLATHLGVKLRTTTQTRWRLGSGLAFKMHHGARQLSLDVHLLTDDWGDNTSDDPSWRVMFRYSIAVAETLPRLVAAIGRLAPDM